MNTTEQDAAETALTEWARITRDRDNRIRRALAADITKNRIHTLTGISRATIDRVLDKESIMSVTTTGYGTWNRVEPTSLTVEATVAVALGEFAADFDTAALVADYRDAINRALPDSVTLTGNEFIGPYHQADRDFDGYPLDEDGDLDIKEIVGGVDFWAIAADHDTTETADAE